MLAEKLQLSDNNSMSADLAYWCEPSVRDRLADYYFGLIQDDELARRIVKLHWSMWRNLLIDWPQQAAQSQRELMRLKKQAFLRPEQSIDADNIVMDEITALIFQRFRRSPNLAKTYAKCLMEAAVRLGGLRSPTV